MVELCENPRLGAEIQIGPDLATGAIHCRTRQACAQIEIRGALEIVFERDTEAQEAGAPGLGSRVEDDARFVFVRHQSVADLFEDA